MAIWEDFEIECTNHLNKLFGAYAQFTHQGGSDSTVPDILAQTKSGKTFCIDAKHSPAQCGQFVLLPDIESHSFKYSKKNVNRLNVYAEQIMHHMNRRFDEYREAGTAGKDIQMTDESSIFSGWIIQTYREKGVQFFISNHFTLLPVERLQRYFEVTAKYRIKRSGSNPIGKSRISSVLNYIYTHDYVITNHRTDVDKLFVQSHQNLHNVKFILQKHEYMFSQRDNDYEIRKLSNTYNANVIFSIKLKECIPGISYNEFIDFLK